MYRKFVIVVLISMACTSSLSSQNVSIDALKSERKAILKNILQLQVKKSDDFPAGAFPSYRRYFYSSHYKPDYNLFYTLLILHNIEKFKYQFDQQELSLLDSAKLNARQYTLLFLNQKNQLSHNFWPKYPPQVFPNGGWLNWFDKMNALPDDIDDCALFALVYENNPEYVGQLKTLFNDFKNGQNKFSKGFYKSDKNSQVYNTWLGKSYPIDIDISVLSNVLLMSSLSKSDYTATDSSSFSLIIKMIKEKKHITDPAYVSQHYANTATIMYHIARLVYASQYTQFNEIKDQLVEEITTALSHCSYSVEAMLLQNALLYLGKEYDTINIPITIDLHKNDYPYFIANMTAILNNPFKRAISKMKIGEFEYYSYPFNLSLKFEQLSLLIVKNK